MIKFTKEEKKIIIPKIQMYFREELDKEIGSFDAEFLLDFFAEEIGGFFYNRALSEVHGLLEKQMESMADIIYELEKPIPFTRENTSD